jgi:signal peptidase I
MNNSATNSNPYRKAALDICQEADRCTYTVSGRCMEPVLFSGHMVDVEKCDINNLDEEDIVLFRRGDTLFLHRLVCRVNNNDNIFLITKGDAKKFPDLPVAKNLLFGKAVSVNNAPISRPSFFVKAQLFFWKVFYSLISPFYTFPTENNNND